MKSFASDNYSGAHANIIKAIESANVDHATGYGDDIYSLKAQKVFNDLFEEEVGLFFVFNGTGANVLAIQVACQSFHAVLCAKTAHIFVDECGAPEKVTGAKLIPIDTPDGKLSPDLIRPHIHSFGNQHHNQPQLISISQVTELGTCYSAEEVRAICDLAHKHGMLVHMDGARISNAAAYLNTPVSEFTNKAGVDLLSFGGTKNGLLFGEALVIFNKELIPHAAFFRKQMAQLHSKMRFISAQYIEYLKNDLWLSLAKISNDQCNKLHKELLHYPRIVVTQKVQSNGIFAILPCEWIPTLQAAFPFYLWNEARCEARLMCAFDTTDADIDAFITLINDFNLKK